MYMINEVLESDIRSQAYLSVPVIFQDYICLIYPLSILEVIKLGQEKFQYYLNLLTLSEYEVQNIMKEKGQELDIEMTPLKYLLRSAAFNEMFLLDVKQAFFTFIREKVTFLFEENKILIGSDASEKRFISEENFNEFQNILRIQNHLQIKEKPPEDETEMAKKFRLKREMVEAVKKKINSNTEESPDLDDLISSLCAYGIGITPFNVGNLSIYAFYDLFERRSYKDSYELDIKSLLAGADSKKIKPKYWVRKMKKS